MFIIAKSKRKNQGQFVKHFVEKMLDIFGQMRYNIKAVRKKRIVLIFENRTTRKRQRTRKRVKVSEILKRILLKQK